MDIQIVYNGFDYVFNISYIICLVLLIIIFNRYKFNKMKILVLIIYGTIGSYIGSRLGWVVYKLINDFSIASLINKGSTSYGGVIAFIALIYLFCFQNKIKFKDMFCLIQPIIWCFCGIQRFGCLITMCCVGIKYTGIGRVNYYNGNNLMMSNRFPIQIVEAIIFLSIVIYAVVKIMQKKATVKQGVLCFILANFSKFMCDYLRATHDYKILSANQIVSIILIIIGMILYFRWKDKDRLIFNNEKLEVI